MSQPAHFRFAADESGSDEDFMVEDDDDSDYGHSKKRGKKVIRRGRPDKKEKKSPKPRLKATGEGVPSACSTAVCDVISEMFHFYSYIYK